jgi:hypothetical protein
VLIDLWSFGGEVVRVVDVEENAYWRIVDGAVDDPDEWRVLPWGLNDFDQNDGMPYGLRSVFGYDPLVLERYENFITSVPDPRAKTYDLLNARYLILPGPQDFGTAPDAPQLIHEEAGVWIYERPGALPRAWIAQAVPHEDPLGRIHDSDFDPRLTALVEQRLPCEGMGPEGGEAEVLLDEGSRVLIQTHGSGGLLVVSAVDYPGGRAQVDGVATPVVRADYVLQAVCVPEGEHIVKLTFDPIIVKVGAGVSATAVLLIVGLCIVTRRREERA